MKKISSIDWLIRLTIVLLLFLCGYMLLKLAPIWEAIIDMAVAVLTPFFVAALITYLLHPIVEKLHHYNIPRPLAILLIYVIFFGGIGYGMYKGIPHFIEQLKTLEAQIPGLVDMYHRWLNEFYYQTADLPETVHDRFRDGLNGVEAWFSNIISGIIQFLKGLLQSLLMILMVPILAFYFLNDFSMIKKVFRSITPKKWRKPGKKLLKDVDHSLGNYVRGQIYVCASLSITAIAVFWWLGVPYPILLGLIIGVTDLIPYFGPFLGAIPVLLVAATVSLELFLYVLIFILVLQFIEGNVLSPLIVGKSLHLHPITIIFVLFIGGEVGGIIGLLLAVPVFVTLRVVFVHVRKGWVSRDEKA